MRWKKFSLVNLIEKWLAIVTHVRFYRQYRFVVFIRCACSLIQDAPFKILFNAIPTLTTSTTSSTNFSWRASQSLGALSEAPHILPGRASQASVVAARWAFGPAAVTLSRASRAFARTSWRASRPPLPSRWWTWRLHYKCVVVISMKTSYVRGQILHIRCDDLLRKKNSTWNDSKTRWAKLARRGKVNL